MSSFKKEIKLFDAVMLVSGSMIGSGIFIVSADVARQLGSTGWLLASWVVAGLLTMVAAMSYGELTGMYPQAGGQYVFLQKAYGKLFAFLYGWAFFLVINTGTIAAVAVGFAKFTGVMLPKIISEDQVIFTITDTIKLTNQRLLAIGSILLLTYINTRGVKQGKRIQNVFSSTKILAMAVIIIIGFWASNSEVIHQNFSNIWASTQVSFNADKSIISIASLSFIGALIALGITQVGTLFSSDAWNGLTFAGDEVVNPQKTIPRGLAIGTLLVTVLYLLMNVVYLFVLPLKGDPNGIDAFHRGIQFASQDRVASATADVIGGTPLAMFVAALIMIATFGCNNGIILAGARVYYAMAKDGLFFKKFGELNKNAVPAWALWGQGIWASLLCLSGRYGDLLDYLMGVTILFYVFTILAIFILRKRNPDIPRPIKAIGYPIIPMLYIIVASLIVLVLIKEKPQYTFPGLGIVALGIPVYYFFKGKS